MTQNEIILEINKDEIQGKTLEGWKLKKVYVQGKKNGEKNVYLANLLENLIFVLIGEERGREGVVPVNPYVATSLVTEMLEKE